LGEHQILFPGGPPDLADSRYVAALRALFSVNTRNVVLLTVYFVVLLALALGALHWVTRGFSQWRLTPLGAGIVGVLALAALLPVWRLVAEEGPHLAYRRPAGDFARLQVVRGTVTAQGSPISLGRPLPMRKLQWRLEQPPAEGSTPYLPEVVARRAPPGSGVWLGVDPGGREPPVFLGFAR
jgi:hypothetical protein